MKALSHVIRVLVPPVFFIAFSLLYNPFDIKGFYSFGNLSYGFHLVMLSCIILLTLILSRGLYHVARRKTVLSQTQYGVWCALEVFAATCFMALYTQLFLKSGGGYFTVLDDCLKFAFLILAYPYVIMSLLYAARRKESASIDLKESPSDGSLVKFFDEHKRLKLTIAKEAILYVNSEANYVNIHYVDGSDVKEYMLRNSMKSVEKSASDNGLVRCHRSFFVNPAHVRVLRKGTDGFTYAELDAPGVNPLPVSKSFYETLSSLL